MKKIACMNHSLKCGVKLRCVWWRETCCLLNELWTRVHNLNMLTAKSNCNHYIQTTISSILLSVKPRLIALPELIIFIHILDAFFEFHEGSTSAKTLVV